MKPALLVAVALAAAAGSLLLTLYLRPGVEPNSEAGPAPETTRSEPTARAADCPDLEPRRRALAAAELTMRATRARIGTLEQERVAIAGDPIPWPEDPELGPAEMADQLETAARDADVSVMEIDCEEDPCVAVVSFHVPEGADMNAVRRDHQERLEEGLGGLSFGGDSQVRPHTFGGEVYTIVGTLRPASEPYPDDPAREQFRRRALSRLVLEEITLGDRDEVPQANDAPREPRGTR